MKYAMKMSIDEYMEVILFEIDIPSDEVQNVQDAFKCEIEYNGFDMPVGDITWLKNL